MDTLAARSCHFVNAQCSGRVLFFSSRFLRSTVRNAKRRSQPSPASSYTAQRYVLRVSQRRARHPTEARPVLKWGQLQPMIRRVTHISLTRETRMRFAMENLRPSLACGRNMRRRKRIRCRVPLVAKRCLRRHSWPPIWRVFHSIMDPRTGNYCEVCTDVIASALSLC